MSINWKDLTILFVEDEDFMRGLVAKLLAEFGVKTVYEAADGADGLYYVNSLDKIDVILCDLEMPGMGGIEFLKSLRSHANAAKAATPLVVLTGHASKENLAGAVEMGIQGFLVKPVSRTNLEKRLGRALTAAPVDPSVLSG